MKVLDDTWAILLVLILFLVVFTGEPSVLDHLRAILSQYSGLEIPKDADQ